jgi:hypothetical protein
VYLNLRCKFKIAKLPSGHIGIELLNVMFSPAFFNASSTIVKAGVFAFLIYSMPFVFAGQ